MSRRAAQLPPHWRPTQQRVVATSRGTLVSPARFQGAGHGSLSPVGRHSSIGLVG